MAELRQRKAVTDTKQLPSSGTSVRADASGRAERRRQPNKDSPLLIIAAPLILLFHIALVRTLGVLDNQIDQLHA